MNEALQDEYVLEALLKFHSLKNIYPVAGKLFHFFSLGSKYLENYPAVRFASEYVYRRLVDMYGDEMLYLARSEFGSKSMSIAMTIFKNYAHDILSGKVYCSNSELRCRNLTTGRLTKPFKLEKLLNPIVNFDEVSDIPRVIQERTYYQGSPRDFLTTNSFTSKFMFVIEIYQIERINRDRYYKVITQSNEKPIIYVIVPEGLFMKYRKFDTQESMEKAQQFVLELPIDTQNEIYVSWKKSFEDSRDLAIKY